MVIIIIFVIFIIFFHHANWRSAVALFDWKSEPSEFELYADSRGARFSNADCEDPWKFWIVYLS